jgi:hypothetical protein
MVEFVALVMIASSVAIFVRHRMKRAERRRRHEARRQRLEIQQRQWEQITTQQHEHAASTASSPPR